jgi:putative phosphoribosyl transferase
MIIFEDRSDAGRQLAQKLLSYRHSPDTIVFGLARGGVVVAYEVAKELRLPLNVLIPRKIGAPDNSELAIGALAEDGEPWLNQSLIESLQISPQALAIAIAQSKALIDERVKKYRQIVPLGPLEGKTAILIDDGIATGATTLAEIRSLRKQKIKNIVVASPVASMSAWDAIKETSDQAICLQSLEMFLAVSEFYVHFEQVEDAQVLHLLEISANKPPT